MPTFPTHKFAHLASVTFVLIQPAFALNAFAASQANTPSQITAVTIYQGTASVTRQLPITGEGEQQVTFGCLSGNLEQNSLQLTAPDGVNIGEINVQTLSGEQAKLCQQQGNPNFTNTQNQLDVINAKLKANETSMAYLDNFGKSDQLNANQNIHNNVNQIRQSAEETTLALASLRQQKAQLESQLASDMNASSAVAKQITQVTAKVASRQNATVTLNYLVNGASWQPQYQASLDTQQRALNLQLQAIIAQTTGENWQNIPVTLSTVQPSYDTYGFDPSAINFKLYDPKAQATTTSKKAKAVGAGISAPTVADEVYSGYINNTRLPSPEPKKELPPLPSYQANINNKNDIVEYNLPQRVTIPSDGRRITTKLDSQTGQAEIWVRVVPDNNHTNYVNSQSAYWYAKAPALSKAWVDGDLKLYRDGNYIGTGKYNRENVSIQGLGFGHNNKILVTELENKIAVATGVSHKNVRIMNKSYRIQNTLSQPMQIEFVSSMPVTLDNEINLTLQYNPEPDQRNWHDKKNFAVWQFILNPQAEKTISEHHKITYPQNKELLENYSVVF